MKNLLHICLSLFIFSILISCTGDSTPDKPAKQKSAHQEAKNKVEVVESYIETGDLDAIKQQGKLRILVMSRNKNADASWLPRKGHPFTEEQELAQQLAQQLQLEPIFVHVNALEELIPALAAGRGDVIAANLTITPSRKEIVDFSVPVDHSREKIVSRINDTFTNKQSLSGRRIAYQAGSSFEETVKKLVTKNPKIQTQIISGSLNEDEILDQLINKKIDLTIMDSNRLGILSGYRDDFRTGLALTGERSLAWAIRKNSPQLLQSINNFLTKHQLTRQHISIFTDDLDAIKKRKTLRVITRNNAASYFLWRGELLGFEYEMVKAFAKAHKLRLEIIAAPDHQSQIPMLIEGKGDLIASFMTINETRKQQGIQFSRAYHKVSEVIVSRKDETQLEKPEDLDGRSLYIRKSSAYWQTLNELQKQGIKLKLHAVPESMETEEIIAKVASGEFDLTLADNHILNIEMSLRDDIKGAFEIGDSQQNAWATRENNPQLLSAINQFLKKQYRSTFYNITYKKYFKNSRKIKKFRDQRIDLNPDGTISPYDTLVKKYAQKFNFDWRLLVAQMYQESRFNPRAKSWAGAQGLMQVMPRTAKELGITNMQDPDAGVRAGVKYMDWVRDRFEPELNVKDRMWFTLAAYNAGQGHVRDARRLAKQRGLNPDRWFDNVERAMLLLSKKKYYKKARYGYVRGSEPVNYVRDIRSRYIAYIKLSETEDN